MNTSRAKKMIQMVKPYECNKRRVLRSGIGITGKYQCTIFNIHAKNTFNF